MDTVDILPPAPENLAKQKRLSIIQSTTSPPLLSTTFGSLLRSRAISAPNSPAIISQHQDEILTYADVNRRSDALASGLLALNVTKGDRVAVMLGNRSEYVDIFFACAKIGAYFTLLNFAYSASEMVQTLRATTSKVLLTTLTSGRYDYSAVLRTIQSQAPSLEKVILLPDISGNRVDFTMSLFFTTYSALLILGKRHQPDWQSLDASVVSSDILNLQFTSGSTGLPKAAALTHSGMINSSQYIGLNMALKPTDSIVIPLPLFHAFGLVIGLTTAWVAGGSAVLPSEYFDAAATLAAVQRYSATGLYGVTTMFIDMLSHPSFAGTNRSTLQFGVMAGSAMPADLTTRIHTRFPIPRLYTNWGMTELSSIATMVTHRDPDHKRLHTAGRLLPNFTMKIVEPNSGSCLPWGARGEIVVAGFGVMAGYFNEPERTASTLKQHSEDLEAGGAGVDPCTGKVRTWMHTGDEGYIDPEGYLVVTGRIKDLIIRGGENIAPLEIEERLFLHPAIKQAAAFGIPSQRYGEEVACLLELDETTTSWDARPSDDEVRRWVRKTLSRFKAPVRIWWLGDKAKGVVAEWPKTANGKLRKKDIREVGEELLKKEQAQEAMVDSPSKIRPSL